MKAKKDKCYIYMRVSTSMQVEGYSLEAQKETLGRGGGLAAARQLLDVGAQLRAPVPRLFGAASGLVEKDERVGREVVRGAGEGVDELHVLVRAA